MKILYEATYAFRGRSGIPRDTESVARALSSVLEGQIDILVNPLGLYGYHNSRNWAKRVKVLGSLNRIPKDTWNMKYRIVISIYECLFMNKKKPIASNEYDKNHLSTWIKQAHKGKVLLTRFSYFSRFIRARILAPFSINTRDYQLFIQQQVDPIRVSRRTIHVVRLHDIIPITHPQFFSKEAVDVFVENFKTMMEYVDCWVVDSNYVKSEIERFFGKSSNIKVMHCIVSKEETYPKIKVNKVLLVATIEPRKNIRTAIEGFQYAIENRLLDEDWVLNVCGSKGWLEDDLYESLKESKFGAGINFIESPGNEKLVKLYQESKLLLSTSHVEGFGLTPLEGMLYGCLPVVSDIPVHREILGDLPVFIEDKSQAHNIAQALHYGVEKYHKGGLTLRKGLTEFVESNYSETVLAKKWEALITDIAI